MTCQRRTHKRLLHRMLGGTAMNLQCPFRKTGIRPPQRLASTFETCSAIILARSVECVAVTEWAAPETVASEALGMMPLLRSSHLLQGIFATGAADVR